MEVSRNLGRGITVILAADHRLGINAIKLANNLMGQAI